MVSTFESSFNSDLFCQSTWRRQLVAPTKPRTAATTFPNLPTILLVHPDLPILDSRCSKSSIAQSELIIDYRVGVVGVPFGVSWCRNQSSN